MGRIARVHDTRVECNAAKITLKIRAISKKIVVIPAFVLALFLPKKACELPLLEDEVCSKLDFDGLRCC